MPFGHADDVALKVSPSRAPHLHLVLDITVLDREEGLSLCYVMVYSQVGRDLEVELAQGPRHGHGALGDTDVARRVLLYTGLAD